MGERNMEPMTDEQREKYHRDYLVEKPHSAYTKHLLGIPLTEGDECFIGAGEGGANYRLLPEAPEGMKWTQHATPDGVNYVLRPIKGK